MDDSPLFRAEAINAQRVQWHGEIIIAQRTSYKALALFAGLMAALLIAFAIWGTYTKRTTVSGQITPSAGIVKLYVPQQGTIVEQHVVEGQYVKKDDVLFVLSSDRQSSTMGDTQAAISEQARLRRQSLREQLQKTEQLRRLDREALDKKLDGLRLEMAKLTTLLDDQRERTNLAKKAFDKYQQLTEKNFISRDQLEQKQADFIDQQSRLESVERDQIATKRNLDDAQSQLDSLSLKYDNQVADIVRTIASTQQELSESEVKRRFTVIATETGTATAITAQLGQEIDVNKPIVSIIPDGATWQAQLYAPSRAVGFIKPGDTVKIRYQAYPYQKFGQYDGKVENIATTALLSAELTGTNAFATGATPGGEPLYQISVNLDSQTITAYGKQQALQAGMLLDADILQETRHLYEWVLEPLYSISGKL